MECAVLGLTVLAEAGCAVPASIVPEEAESAARELTVQGAVEFAVQELIAPAEAGCAVQASIVPEEAESAVRELTAQGASHRVS